MKELRVFKNPEVAIDRETITATRQERVRRFLEVQQSTSITADVLEGSELELVLFQNAATDQAVQVMIELNVHASALATLTLVQKGGASAHISVVTHVVGRGADVQISGLQSSTHSQKHMFEVHTIHKVPHTKSDLNVWCAADDNAQSIFNGTITIEKGAPQTEALQKNKNLLLSESAVIQTVPKLWISNHDVKCSHGSSVSTFDENAFFYLESRGISRLDAEGMLYSGFINQALSLISDEVIRKDLGIALGANLHE